MNIEQIKQDHENGVSVSKETYRKLVEAALLMKEELEDIAKDASRPISYRIHTNYILDRVEAL